MPLAADGGLDGAAARRDYNAGTVADDVLLHAAIGPSTLTIAACGAGRIRYAAPTPFVAGGEDFCPDCAARVGSPQDD